MEGIHATNLPPSTDVIEVIGIKDNGGGVRSVVRITLVNFVSLIGSTFSEVAARASAEAQRATGIATNTLSRVRLMDASVARVAAEARRALGLAQNATIRVKKLDDVQIKLKAEVFN